MDKCPGLIGGLNDPSTSCNIQCPINEQIEGVLPKLPGNNPLGQWGVGPSSGPAPSSAGSSSASVVAHVVTTPSAPASDPPTSDPPTVVPTTVASAAVVTTASPTTAVASESASGTADPTTPFVTSYVFQTSVVLTTVTLPAPTGTSSPVPVGWSYKGCYSDNVNARVLTGIEFADIGNHEVTNTKCTTYCDSKGYSLAGTEYGGQCFCGNELTGSSSLDNSKCDMPCEGDSTQTCGGSAALSVYSKSGSARRHLQRIRGSSQ